MKPFDSDSAAPGHPDRGYADLTRLSDAEIMVCVQAGNDDALAVLFDRYHRLVLSIGYKILRDLGEAEDLMQGVFLEFYRVAVRFDSAKGTVKTWLLQYAYHRSMNRRKYLARRNFYGLGDLGEAAHLLDSEGLNSEAMFSTVEARKMLGDAIQSLNAVQRRTIQMAYFEGMTLREISEQTGEPVGNVRHHFYRGLSRLRVLVTAKNSAKQSETLARGIVNAKA
jgi:RNA polymerase sigma-70 factor (ECF subfamily)